MSEETQLSRNIARIFNTPKVDLSTIPQRVNKIRQTRGDTFVEGSSNVIAEVLLKIIYKKSRQQAEKKSGKKAKQKAITRDEISEWRESKIGSEVQAAIYNFILANPSPFEGIVSESKGIGLNGLHSRMVWQFARIGLFESDTPIEQLADSSDPALLAFVSGFREQPNHLEDITLSRAPEPVITSTGALPSQYVGNFTPSRLIKSVMGRGETTGGIKKRLPPTPQATLGERSALETERSILSTERSTLIQGRTAGTIPEQIARADAEQAVAPVSPQVVQAAPPPIQAVVTGETKIRETKTRETNPRLRRLITATLGLSAVPRGLLLVKEIQNVLPAITALLRRGTEDAAVQARDILTKALERNQISNEPFELPKPDPDEPPARESKLPQIGERKVPVNAMPQMDLGIELPGVPGLGRPELKLVEQETKGLRTGAVPTMEELENAIRTNPDDVYFNILLKKGELSSFYRENIRLLQQLKNAMEIKFGPEEFSVKNIERFIQRELETAEIEVELEDDGKDEEEEDGKDEETGRVIPARPVSPELKRASFYDSLPTGEELKRAIGDVPGVEQIPAGRITDEQFDAVVNIVKNTASAISLARFMSTYRGGTERTQTRGTEAPQEAKVFTEIKIQPPEAEEVAPLPTEGVGQLRPKFVMPGSDIVAPEEGEMAEDEAEFDAFNFIQPEADSEGNLDNPLHILNQVEEVIKSGEKIQSVYSMFGMTRAEALVQYEKDLQKIREFKPPLFAPGSMKDMTLSQVMASPFSVEYNPTYITNSAPLEQRYTRSLFRGAGGRMVKEFI